MGQDRGDQGNGDRPLPPRPFPAIDPEPDRRFTWRGALRAAAVCAVAGAAAAAVALMWPAPGPRSASARTRLADSGGLVVFEEQPSGLLGTALPDGSHPVILAKLGGLQGNDLPVASSDGHYLVTQEGQLVTMGPHGPVSVTDLASGAAASSSDSWVSVSFADGDRYVAATECDTAGSVQDWVARLLPTAAGKAGTLGQATSSTGDPSSAAALVSVPAGTSQQNGPGGCYGASTASDRAIELLAPGEPPRTVVTVGTLLHAVGWPPKTPVQLFAMPSPDGALLDVSVVQNTPSTGATPPNRLPVITAAAVLVSRTGRIVSRIPLPRIAGQVRWSPDGKKIAACEAYPGTPSRVVVWTVGGTVKTITLRNRHDVYCTQLLWSPDGSQLIYAAMASERGLTASADLQHGWTVIDLRTGQTHDVTAPGQPAAWLPSPRRPAASGGTP